MLDRKLLHPSPALPLLSSSPPLPPSQMKREREILCVMSSSVWCSQFSKRAVPSFLASFLAFSWAHDMIFSLAFLSFPLNDSLSPRPPKCVSVRPSNILWQPLSLSLSAGSSLSLSLDMSHAANNTALCPLLKATCCCLPLPLSPPPSPPFPFYVLSPPSS